jgi:hypothetical protein
VIPCLGAISEDPPRRDPLFDLHDGMIAIPPSQFANLQPFIPVAFGDS